LKEKPLAAKKSDNEVRILEQYLSMYKPPQAFQRARFEPSPLVHVLIGFRRGASGLKSIDRSIFSNLRNFEKREIRQKSMEQNR